MVSTKRRFVLNTRSGVLHRLPSRCSVEKLPRRDREYYGSIEAATLACRKKCWRCFPLLRFEEAS